jgi:hypothetical protein
MSNATCAVCGAAKQRAHCTVIVLTEDEKASMENPPDEYVYCKPCWKVLSDPVNSTALMKGLTQAKLRSLGVDDDRAESAAAQFVKKLAARSTQRSS